MSFDAYPRVRDWMRVEGGRLVVRTGKVDLGQRISTALARIAAEELTIGIDLIDVAPVRTGNSPDEGITSGSNSIEQSGRAQRLACATARAWAVAHVAQIEGAPGNEIVVKDGEVAVRNSNYKFKLLDLMADMPEDLAVDPTAELQSVSTPLGDAAPFGLREMVEGRFSYVHDLERPGMLHARIIRPPLTDAVLTSLDPEAEQRLQAQGLHIIRDGSFLAVAGPQEWSVVRGAETLARGCKWDIGKELETGNVFEIMEQRDAHRLSVIGGTPDAHAPVPAKLDSPDYTARFERPYTLHGALGPSAALATYRDGQLEVFTHSQGLYFLRASIADSLGLAEEDVVLEHAPGSGCYGHNAADDAAFEAALVALALPGKPILLKYSRADEHGREPVSTAMAVTVQAKVAAAGTVDALWVEARGDTHRGRPRSGPNRAGPARLAANAARDCDVPRFQPEPNMNTHAGLHRNLDPIYNFPDTRTVKALVPDLPLRPSALRCLGATANVFALESTMDMLAKEAGQDPISYRIQHLDDPRAISVLEHLRGLLTAPPGKDVGRGIAYAQYKNAMTRVGIAVDLKVGDSGRVQLEHVHLVADAGRVVDPDGLRAQLEGGVLQGASWALYENVTWGPDGRDRLDWESYPVLRFDDVPEIDIHVLAPENDRARGAGEATPAPTVAAIANAIHDATGLRLHRMPFDSDAILKAAFSV